MKSLYKFCRQIWVYVTCRVLCIGHQAFSHGHFIVKSHLKDPEFPALVSFPRTGSHWFRNLTELYFGQPSLTRAFYYPRRAFMYYSTHDLNQEYPGDFSRDNVIYLYRDPLETMYSYMKYMKYDIDDREQLSECCQRYKEHLDKWLNTENPKKQCLIRYNSLKDRPSETFAKVCTFFETPFNEEQFMSVYHQVSKASVKKRTNDKRVVVLKDDYQTTREDFAEKNADFVSAYFKEFDQYF